jgi:4-hydroxy-2-oxoheptanedioate aldolase
MANVAFRELLLGTSRSLAGLITSIGSAELIACIGNIGLDFIIIDTEHGAISIESTAAMVRAAQSVNLAALVRVPSYDAARMGRLCDVGVDGLVLPRVETATIAQEFVKSLRYPPLGTRGIRRATPASEWGRRGVVEHIDIEKAGICAIIQIETVRGVEAARAILSVAGVDAVIVGINDLSVSMNLPGETNSDQVRQRSREIVEAAHEYGVACGGAGQADEIIGDLVASGCRLIVGDLALCVAESAKQFVSSARAAL